MKTMLIYPPLDDPTMPYHSLAYLAGHLNHNGVRDVSIRDINIEYTDYCLQEEIIESYQSEIRSKLEGLSKLPELSFMQQEQYYLTWAINPVSPSDIKRAAGGLRDPDRFLDFPLYLENAKLIVRYFGLLGALSYPAEIVSMRQKSKGRFSLYYMNDLLNTELSDKICRPFAKYFDQKLRNDDGIRNADLFGISIIYDHQLPYALYLARRLKESFPEKLVVLGGTAISQLYKYLNDKGKMRRFFDLCDAIVVGEGETAICEIVTTGGELKGRTGLPNTITYDSASDTLHLPVTIHYENVNSLGSPVYDFPWELYLSPQPGISYAPTRGCYWNRCTFCDYGLNTDMPTSPWRERGVERVVEDLADVCGRQKVKYVYFAVDVMAPGYIERLSDAIIASGLEIRWSAELRMEKIFSEQRCVKMAKSGCVCVSFGMESGNQRVLDLIDKGTRVDYMAETMKNFTAAGVAVQLMAFSDFPTETSAEKRETIDFVNNNSEYWSTGGIGAFMLTGTSIIAKSPERFGITLMKAANADTNREVAYRLNDESERNAQLTEENDESFGDHKEVFPRVPKRPWAGGTDTLHSMIYYDFYGRNFFRQYNLDTVPSVYQGEGGIDELRDLLIYVPGRLGESGFDIAAILENHKMFAKRIKELLLIPLEPTQPLFEEWQATIELLRRQPQITFWITLGDRCARLSQGIYKIIALAERASLTTGDVLAIVPQEIRPRLLDNLKSLQEGGLIQFRRPAQ